MISQLILADDGFSEDIRKVIAQIHKQPMEKQNLPGSKRIVKIKIALSGPQDYSARNHRGLYPMYSLDSPKENP